LKGYRKPFDFPRFHVIYPATLDGCAGAELMLIAEN
jgi:hypothetical protein